MQNQHTRLPAMNAATLRALVEILSPYRSEILTPAVMALALKLARLEAQQ